MSAVGTPKRRIVQVLGTVAALVIGVNAVHAAFGKDDGVGEVVRVIDGDTIVALVAGEETTIRLLNIDTPETKHPGQPVQCLGPEATAFLTDRLPEGTKIQLEYDQEREDPYGRTLAGVFESDSLINAEIAAAGLGVPVVFKPNDRFLSEVRSAAADAQEKGLGLFGTETDCTIPAQLQTLASAAEQLPATVEGDPTDAIAEAATAVEDLEVFIDAIDPDGLRGLHNAVLAAPLVKDTVHRWRQDAKDVHERADKRHEELEEQGRAYAEEQERKKKEREERERREREEREERERKEREEREERERQEERERAARSTPAPAPQQPQPAPQQPQPAPQQQKPAPAPQQPAPAPQPAPQKQSSGSDGSSCVPYGPEIPHADDGGYTGKRYGMPGGKTFRKCR
ncbi:thermonuclease family protein [Brachybacterium sp. UMB0905]|uniref:thermonuclease family protein n=1 Tax=Brachybacterium sp. UMB0905 TaxID=2069310 RepID=UPI0018EDCDE5|nr:thermonuclease family protein [Brachybacterium sp. UMB0905]